MSTITKHMAHENDLDLTGLTLAKFEVVLFTFHQ